MCKAHSKVTHIKQQKYFHHLKRRGYNKKSVLYPGRLRWWKYFCCFICVTLLWALYIVIKQQFFYIYMCWLWWFICFSCCCVNSWLWSVCMCVVYTVLLLWAWCLSLTYKHIIYLIAYTHVGSFAQWQRFGLDQRSCTASDPVSTRMGDHLWAGKPSQYVTSHLGQLSFLPSVGW